MIKISDTELDAIFYRTLLCEFTTMAESGPVTTPMQHAWLPDHGVFVLSSALGVRFKIDRLFRNPKCALSLSEFTGSGLGPTPAFLIQGHARVPLAASGIDGLEDFWASNLRKKPDQRPAAFMKELREDDRRLFYIRARIEVVPERVFRLTGKAGEQQMTEIS